MKQTLSERLRSGSRSYSGITVGNIIYNASCLEAADALDLAEKVLEDALASARFTNKALGIDTGTSDKIRTALKAIKGVE